MPRLDIINFVSLNVLLNTTLDYRCISDCKQHVERLREDLLKLGEKAN